MKFIQYVKSHAKTVTASMVIASMAILSSISCFAADTSSLTTDFSSSLSTIQSDILGYIGIALPVGLAIFGAIIAIKKAIGFVKSLLGKAS